MERIAIIAVGLAILLSGCNGNPAYSLGPTATVMDDNEGVIVQGDVLLAGSYSSDLRVVDVELEVWDNGEVSRTLNVGNLSQERPRVNFSVRAPRPPDRLIVRFRRQTQPEHDGHVYGLEWVPDEQSYKEIDVRQGPGHIAECYSGQDCSA